MEPTSNDQTLDSGSQDQAPSGSGVTLVILQPRFGAEPLKDLSDEQARSQWVTMSAPWHPRLLAACRQLPRLEGIEQAQAARADEIRIVPAGAGLYLAPGYESAAISAGCRLIEAGIDRTALVSDLLENLPDAPSDSAATEEPFPQLAEDFQAIGAAYAVLMNLSILMGHADVLNQELLAAEVLPAAEAWCRGDSTSALNRLRAAFEVLSQARERFFPIDSYLVDLTLVDGETPTEAIGEMLATRVPVSLLATGAAIDRLASRSPELGRQIADGVNAGWVDVLGGAYQELEESLLPLESIVFQYARGAESYRRNLDERTVETLARRRFGLYPMQPQVARRFGMRYGLPMAFDGGRFPVPKESKRIWESPDGSTLECLTRIPLAADQWSGAVQFPARLAWSMKNDHVAVLPLIHWPAPVAGWYADLRRTATYAPVFGRWVTAGDFFHLSDRPWEVLRPGTDSFSSPYLQQAVARRDPAPVSRLIGRVERRAELDVTLAVNALGRALRVLQVPAAALEAGSFQDPRALELQVEGADGDQVNNASGCSEALQNAAVRLAESLSGGSADLAKGYLMINTLPFSRRVPMTLNPGQVDLGSPARQILLGETPDPATRIVDLPAMGFVWLSEEESEGRVEPGYCHADQETRVLRSSRFEVGFDPISGGLKGIKRTGEMAWRVGLQLVALGLKDADGQPRSSVMAAREFEVDTSRADLVQAVSRGEVLDPVRPEQPLAKFVLRAQLWADRSTLELEVEITEIDETWRQSFAGVGTDPWSSGLALRWAWPDANAVLKRSNQLGLETTTAERPETSELFEIISRPHHTALLMGGLSYHQRRGGRMLDSMLIVGDEAERRFGVGVSLDLENPIDAALDRLYPAVVVPAAAPAHGVKSGWFLNLDQRHVQITRVEFAERTYDGRGWGLILHLLETGNKASRCRLRLFVNPQWARQIDCQGDLIVDLSTTDDTVMIDLTPREFATVEITLGLHDLNA